MRKYLKLLRRLLRIIEKLIERYERIELEGKQKYLIIEKERKVLEDIIYTSLTILGNIRGEALLKGDKNLATKCEAIIETIKNLEWIFNIRKKNAFILYYNVLMYLYFLLSYFLQQF